MKRTARRATLTCLTGALGRLAIEQKREVTSEELLRSA